MKYVIVQCIYHYTQFSKFIETYLLLILKYIIDGKIDRDVKKEKVNRSV